MEISIIKNEEQYRTEIHLFGEHKTNHLKTPVHNHFKRKVLDSQERMVFVPNPPKLTCAWILFCFYKGSYFQARLFKLGV